MEHHGDYVYKIKIHQGKHENINCPDPCITIFLVRGFQKNRTSYIDSEGKFPVCTVKGVSPLNVYMGNIFVILRRKT